MQLRSVHCTMNCRRGKHKCRFVSV